MLHGANLRHNHASQLRARARIQDRMAELHKNLQNHERWLFRLFINPQRAESRRLMATLEEFCRKFIKNEGVPCEVRIMDVIAEPSSAIRERILATPTLCLNVGRRAQRIVGNFSEADIFRICFLNPLHRPGPGETASVAS